MRDTGDTHPIAAVARRQKGLVRTDQLLALGLTRAAMSRLVGAGWLHRVHTRVWAVGHTALSRDARHLAATYALWPAAVLSHGSAAELWRLVAFHPALHVTVPTYAGHPHRDAVRVHRQRLRHSEVGERHGVPCTNLVRTVMDLAASAPFKLSRAFEEAQVRHQLQPALLAADLVARPGHRGTGRLRLLLVDAVDPGQVESILELRFLKLCVEQGLPRPLTQVWFGSWRADFWFREQRVVVETDGRRYHASAAKRARDARKDSDLQARGETVIHVRWVDVVDAPAAVAARIRAAFPPR